ncbi:type II toxin-antitoxin system VapC family toxin [Compostibacter hankyongensis]|uniref:Ribonuclease VapC n=1 Tax=Compostibacter hankyongensis TaxID=1007089 RepID=A0ABP8FSE8_9BACT
MEKKNPIICDSDILIDYFNEKSTRYRTILRHLQSFENNNLPICISIITKMELIQGSKNKAEIDRLLKKLIFHLTEEVSALAFRFVQDFSKSHALQIPDALIAATAVTFNIPLYTYNKKHFKYIPGINLYVP